MSKGGRTEEAPEVTLNDALHERRRQTLAYVRLMQESLLTASPVSLMTPRQRTEFYVGTIECVGYLLLILSFLLWLMQSHSHDPLMMMGLQVGSLMVMCIMIAVVLSCLYEDWRNVRK